jgi:hypothetical protein
MYRGPEASRVRPPGEFPGRAGWIAVVNFHGHENNLEILPGASHGAVSRPTQDVARWVSSAAFFKLNLRLICSR